MTEFIAILVHLPAAPFGGLLVVALAYWLFALVGGLDLDGPSALEVTEGPPPLTTYLFRHVPVTVWVSLFAIWGWLVAFGFGWAQLHLLERRYVGWTSSLAGVLGAVLLGGGMAELTGRPLAPLFRSHPGRLRSSLTGDTVRVTTSRVDSEFGQGRIQAGNDDLVVQLRNDRANNGLQRGDRALVVGFDEQRQAYVVEPIARLSNTSEGG
jgi:hypothetical protein